MNNGKYTILLNKDMIAIGKSICYIDLTENEIEITEEQYNQINKFPLILTFDEYGKLIAWEQTELPHEASEPIVVELTTEERIAALEMAVSFMLGM